MEKIRHFSLTVTAADGTTAAVTVDQTGVNIPEGYTVKKIGIVQIANGGSDRYGLGVRDKQNNEVIQNAHKSLRIASESTAIEDRYMSANLKGGKVYNPMIRNDVAPSGSDRVVEFEFIAYKDEE